MDQVILFPIVIIAVVCVATAICAKLRNKIDRLETQRVEAELLRRKCQSEHVPVYKEQLKNAQLAEYEKLILNLKRAAMADKPLLIGEAIVTPDKMSARLLRKHPSSICDVAVYRAEGGEDVRQYHESLLKRLISIQSVREEF